MITIVVAVDVVVVELLLWKSTVTHHFRKNGSHKIPIAIHSPKPVF